MGHPTGLGSGSPRNIGDRGQLGSVCTLMRTALVHTEKKCYFHEDRPAVYDAKTRTGPWAYVCEVCFQAFCYRNTQELAFRLEVRNGDPNQVGHHQRAEAR